MTSVIFAALMLALSQEVLGSCNTQYYAYDTEAGCAVSLKILIPFPIKTTTPDQSKCDNKKTICSVATATGAVVRFRGKIPTATEKITISDGTTSSIVQVIHRVAKQEVADPLVGVFPAATIADAQKLVFTVTIPTPTITAAGDLQEGTIGTDCTAAKLCYKIDGDKVNVWGTRGTFDKITVNGADGAKVVIPLRTVAANQVNPNPLALVLAVGSEITGTLDISVGIVATTVTPNAGALENKEVCGNNEGCYQIQEANFDVALTGVMPSDMHKIEYTGHNAGEYISYTFNGAARLLAAGLLPVLLAFLASM